MNDGIEAEKTQDTNELFAALAIAQGEFTSVNPDKYVSFKTKGGEVKYNYASLAVIIQMARKSLCENGLSILQITQNSNLITMLAHKSGQYISSVIPLPDSSDIKQLGANLSYLRRYQYTSIIGVAIKEEDDENVVEGNVVVSQSEKKAQPIVSPRPSRQPNRNYLDNLFDEVQKQTNNYYSHKAHLYNALGKWPQQDDKKAIAEAIETAVTHVNRKLDAKAALE